MNATVFVDREQQYKRFKDLSTDAEKDTLIVEMLRESTEFEDKNTQIEVAFGNWQKIQKEKVVSSIINYLVLMRLIKHINEDEIQVGIRPVSNKFEIWVICKNKDFSILDSIFELYQSVKGTLPRPVEFVFVSEEQFVGKDNVKFSAYIQFYSMDVYTRHINQFQHNKDFLNYGISNERKKFSDWEITVNFYAAVHLIEAVMSSECGINEIRTHDERQDKMEENREVFSPVLTLYFKLKTLARTARYCGIVDVNEKDSRQAQTYLEDIEFGLRKYIR